jgi:two-component system nitrogen regulation response regulator NtrX
LQEQRFHKVGGTQAIEVDVRVLATTNRNLEDLMKEGGFRQDLYYRLNVVPLHMPPLRERHADIPELADNFLKIFLAQSGHAERSFNSSAISVLKAHKWPGNVRQLRNVVEWVVIMNGAANVSEFGPEHLPPEFQKTNSSGNAKIESISNDQSAYMDLPLREAREAFEREYLLAQVDRFDGNISKTAQFVGMERSALHRKLKSLQIGGDKDDVVVSVDDIQKRASV